MEYCNRYDDQVIELYAFLSKDTNSIHTSQRILHGCCVINEIIDKAYVPKSLDNISKFECSFLNPITTSTHCSVSLEYIHSNTTHLWTVSNVASKQVLLRLKLEFFEPCPVQNIESRSIVIKHPSTGHIFSSILSKISFNAGVIFPGEGSTLTYLNVSKFDHINVKKIARFSREVSNKLLIDGYHVVYHSIPAYSNSPQDLYDQQIYHNILADFSHTSVDAGVIKKPCLVIHGASSRLTGLCISLLSNYYKKILITTTKNPYTSNYHSSNQPLTCHLELVFCNLASPSSIISLYESLDDFDVINLASPSIFSANDNRSLKAALFKAVYTNPMSSYLCIQLLRHTSNRSSPLFVSPSTILLSETTTLDSYQDYYDAKSLVESLSVDFNTCLGSNVFHYSRLPALPGHQLGSGIMRRTYNQQTVSAAIRVLVQPLICSLPV